MKNVDRADLLEVDNEYGRDLSWSGYKWNMEVDDREKMEKTGYFTGRIPIFDTDGRKEILSIYTLDS